MGPPKWSAASSPKAGPSPPTSTDGGGEGEPAGLGGEVAVPVAVPDLGGVTPPYRHIPIAGQHAGVIDAELVCDSGHDRLRYRGRVRLERADRPCRPMRTNGRKSGASG